MTPPRRVPPATSTPAPGSPDETPEVKAARSAVDQAGYARNSADAKYKAAVKDHGQDSAEAKTAKAELDQAQSKVETAQADLRKALKLSTGPKPTPQSPSKTPREDRSAPAPKPTSTKPKTEDQAPKNFERVEKIFIELPPVRGEVIRFNSEVRETILRDPKFPKSLDKLLNEIQKAPKPQGGYLRMLQVHGESSRKIQAPEPSPPAPKADN